MQRRSTAPTSVPIIAALAFRSIGARPHATGALGSPGANWRVGRQATCGVAQVGNLVSNA